MYMSALQREYVYDVYCIVLLGWMLDGAVVGWMVLTR